MPSRPSTPTPDSYSASEIPATEQGQLDGLRWAHELAQDIAWAIEDCRHVSQRLERSLVSAGERVLRVAPKLMGASRRGEREPGKSDQIDARAIARAVLREGIERFPAAFLDEQAIEIRLLCDHREVLVAERTRLINRLRWNLVVLDPELEARIPPPIPASSGRRDRHRLHRGGNRQLNRALHIIAITRGRIDPQTRAYLQRKEAEGKSRMEAMRCLKRHLARHYHQLLLRPSAEAPN
jgi:transposase